MIKIGSIEDDLTYQQSLKASLHLEPDMTCLISAGSIEQFWKILPTRAQLDILFIDIDLPGQSGLEALPALRQRFPDADLVMLTQIEEKEQLLQAFTSGATGYLLKDFPALQLPSFIRIVRNGGALISPQMARWVIEYFNPPKANPNVITTKEEQLLKLFAEGYSYQEAANVLGISVDGVKYHVKKVYTKLNVNNKIDAIRAIKGKL